MFGLEKTADKINYLEDERQKLWADLQATQGELKEAKEAIEVLKEEVAKKTSDYEQSAKESAAAAKQALAKIQPQVTEVETFRSQAQAGQSEITTIATDIRQVSSEIENAQSQLESCTEILTSATNQKAQIDKVLAELETRSTQTGEQLETLEEDQQRLTQLSADVDGIASKIKSAHSQAVKKGGEITGLHDEVFGYATTDEETGEDTHVKGKKDELEDSYAAIEDNLAGLGGRVTAAEERQETAFNSFKQAKEREWGEINEKIRGLLPDAMTAGLSHAYEKKRTSEETEGSNAAKTFQKAIIGLTAISLIPVGVSLYSFFKEGKSLTELLERMPQTILAVLPIYIPLLWFAVSASRRIKLAKRLVEEYAHKEALSKTFEGLYTQIENLPDDDASNQLRARLLYNMVAVSSENPGKLISDYNSTDNPLLDALDKRQQLDQSLDQVEQLPGGEKLAAEIERPPRRSPAKTNKRTDDEE